MIAIKPGVELAGLTPQAVLAMITAASLCAKYGYNFTLTSVREGTHSPGSLHYVGRAFDFRTKHIRGGHRDTIVTELQTALGREFDVVYEPGEAEHCHVEWDPDYLKGKRG